MSPVMQKIMIKLMTRVLTAGPIFLIPLLTLVCDTISDALDIS